MNTPQPIFEQGYWTTRLNKASTKGGMHRAVFETSEENWEHINSSHIRILREHVGPITSILDVGCGWGRLLSLLPKAWKGMYVGVDLSQSFINVAERTYPNRHFICHDMREPLNEKDGAFDLAVLISIRPMVIRNAGGHEWDRIEYNVRRLCNRILYLEYDVNDPGELVIVRNP